MNIVNMAAEAKKSKFSSKLPEYPPRSSWKTETLAEKLSVTYVAVDKPSPQDYMAILHDKSMANIPCNPIPDGLEIDLIKLYSSIIVEPNLNFHAGLSVSALLSADSGDIASSVTTQFSARRRDDHSQSCRENPSNEKSSAETVARKLVDDEIGLTEFVNQLAECRRNIQQFRDRINRTHERHLDYIICCNSMLRFVGCLMKLLQKCFDNKQIDEDAFRLLFLHFANIYKVDMQLVSESLPLVVQGKEVVSVPDLVYEKFPCVPITNLSLTQEVFTVTVSEVKMEAKPDSSIKLQSLNENLHGRKRERCIDEMDQDATKFPSNLRGRHACQLVKGLPNTYMPNKDCMLGFVVEATKVRLTCLVMTKEHRKLLELEEFEERATDYSASIYFTRSYDMLSKEDRQHLLYIMVTLSKLTGDLQRNDQ